VRIGDRTPGHQLRNQSTSCAPSSRTSDSVLREGFELALLLVICGTMSALVRPYAFVDFQCSDTLRVLAVRLSQGLFAGIEVVGENTGIWDEVPAMRLATDFLGLSVELGGDDGNFALHIEPRDFPWELVPQEEDATASVDLAGYVAHHLDRIPGISVT
jgi:hypothetical protein